MLKEIVTGITPDNIKDIQLLKDSLDIFLDYLTENSDIAIDIKNILDENKKELYTEFVKVYLRNIYDVLSSAKHNENLFRKLTTLYTSLGMNIEDVDLSIDITGILRKDFLLTGKDYSESKGNSKAMEYIYDVILKSGIQKDISNNDVGSVFNFTEGPNIFEYNVEGDLIPSVYEHFVKPLTHPVGWAYFYKRIFYLGFTDYFRINFDYTIREIKVKCMKGFTSEEDDYVLNVSHFKARFDADPTYGDTLTAERDLLIDENLTLDPNSEDYKSNIRLINIYNKSLGGDFTLVNDPTVKFINTEEIGIIDVAIRKTIHFVSGEKLEATETVGIVLYDANNQTLIDYKKDYDGNCGLFTDYDEKLTTLVTDDIELTPVMPLASTTGKLNVVGAGNVFVGSTISGDDLVNKNISVTYQSVVAKNDNTSVTNVHSPASPDTTTCYADKRFKRAFGNSHNWDTEEIFGSFDFDGYTKEELDLLSKSFLYKREENAYSLVSWDNNETYESFRYDDIFISDKELARLVKCGMDMCSISEHNQVTWDSNKLFDKLNFNYDDKLIGCWNDKRFIGNSATLDWDSGINLETFDYDFKLFTYDEIENLSKKVLNQKTYGATARDEYSFEQIPNHQAQVNYDFTDNFTGSTYWDSDVNFGTFIYDVNKVSDEFKIEQV